MCAPDANGFKDHFLLLANLFLYMVKAYVEEPIKTELMNEEAEKGGRKRKEERRKDGERWTLIVLAPFWPPGVSLSD